MNSDFDLAEATKCLTIHSKKSEHLSRAFHMFCFRF